MLNKPTHIVYHVKDTGTPGDGEQLRGFWTKIGVAWPHSDAKGFTVVLDAVPVDGRLVVREAVQAEKAPEVQAGEQW